MESRLHDQILNRLLSDDKLDSLSVDLVDAACQGQARLEQVIWGSQIERPVSVATPESGE